MPRLKWRSRAHARRAAAAALLAEPRLKWRSRAHARRAAAAALLAELLPEGCRRSVLDLRPLPAVAPYARAAALAGAGGRALPAPGLRTLGRAGRCAHR